MKKWEMMIEDIENDMILGEAKMRRTRAKLLHKCEELIYDINNDISRNFQKPRKSKKQNKESDICNIKDEVLNIVSINARGIARKKKNIRKNTEE